MVEYDAAFFADIVAPGAIVAARAILPDVLHQLGGRLTVIDVGCGNGAWLSVAAANGCLVHGVDGYATPEVLLMDPQDFEQADLTNGYNCAGYDLAICLEVGEHLPESSADALVAGLCKANYVLFGSAIPEQGGVGHVNEQWQTWWAAKFEANGYGGTVDFQQENWDNAEVEPYYLANPVLYARFEVLDRADYRIGVRDVVHPRLWEYKIGALKEAIRDR